MNFEACLTKTIERAVRTAVQEELKDFKEEISNFISARSKNRNITKDRSQPESKIIRPKELANMLSMSISTLYPMQDEENWYKDNNVTLAFIQSGKPTVKYQ